MAIRRQIVRQLVVGRRLKRAQVYLWVVLVRLIVEVVRIRKTVGGHVSRGLAGTYAKRSGRVVHVAATRCHKWNNTRTCRDVQLWITLRRL